MRIAELTAWHLRIPLKKTVRHASRVRRETDSLVVRCCLKDGTEGWGEGLPREYVTGETIETAVAQLDATDLVGQLSGRIDGIDDAIRRLSDFSLGEVPGDGDPPRRDCFGNAARCAVEVSVLDAVTRACEVPFSRITSHVAETIDIRQEASNARYSLVFTPTRRWKVRVRGSLLRLFGFHQAKVKVGVADVDDAAFLGLVRRWAGPKVDLRLDANEAWTCEELVERLSPLLGHGVTSLEQPVPHSQVEGLAEVRKDLDVLLMLDESLCSLSDARRAIERATCDLFNIRLSKCGGFLNSLRVAALAHQAGLGYQLGCQVGETGILSAAGRHFATSVADIRYLEGSFDRYLVRERLTVEDLTFGRGGYAPALTGPGLGVQVDPLAIQRVEVKRRDWTIDTGVV